MSRKTLTKSGVVMQNSPDEEHCRMNWQLSYLGRY